MQEKIPELVVPSLEGFEVRTYLAELTLGDLCPHYHTQLKPYVSYSTPDVSGKRITAEDLLDISGHPS